MGSEKRRLGQPNIIRRLLCNDFLIMVLWKTKEQNALLNQNGQSHNTTAAAATAAIFCGLLAVAVRWMEDTYIPLKPKSLETVTQVSQSHLETCCINIYFC